MSLSSSINFKIIRKPRNEQISTDKILKRFRYKIIMIISAIIIIKTGVLKTKKSMRFNNVVILSKPPPDL